jgi:hypothetical protein
VQKFRQDRPSARDEVSMNALVPSAEEIATADVSAISTGTYHPVVDSNEADDSDLARNNNPTEAGRRIK